MKNYTFSEYLRGRDSQFAGQSYMSESEQVDNLKSLVEDGIDAVVSAYRKGDYDRMKTEIRKLEFHVQALAGMGSMLDRSNPQHAILHPKHIRDRAERLRRMNKYEHLSEGMLDFFTGGSKSDMDKLIKLVDASQDEEFKKIMKPLIPKIKDVWERKSAQGPGGAARLAHKGIEDSAGAHFARAQKQAAASGRPAPAGKPAAAPAGRPAPAPSDSGRTGAPRANVVPGASTFAAPSPKTGGVMRKVEKTPPAPPPAPRREIDLSSKSYIAK